MRLVAFASLTLVAAVAALFFAGCDRGRTTPGGKVEMDVHHSAVEPAPSPTVRLVFIHHSVGGHWLTHNEGGLVRALNAEGFFVSDITYGWDDRPVLVQKARQAAGWVTSKIAGRRAGAPATGDMTDIGQMYEWFLGPRSRSIMNAVYRESGETSTFGDHANDARLRQAAAGLENEIIVFKSCYPNSMLRGNPDDAATTRPSPPRNFTADSPEHTVANAKRTFNDLLVYFRSRPDKFFVVMTPPPRVELPDGGRTARGFAQWLQGSWLQENRYPLRNVMVFDLYNVLTSAAAGGRSDAESASGNHHRLWKGEEQHVVSVGGNTLAYPRKCGDNHPSAAGLQKATADFVPLLLAKYRQWQKDAQPRRTPEVSKP